MLNWVPDSYGTNEFEVTTERLGCYQPTEHIDNPKGYGDGVDGRDYDRRLRGPVDERRELAIDHRTGMTLTVNFHSDSSIDNPFLATLRS